MTVGHGVKRRQHVHAHRLDVRAAQRERAAPRERGQIRRRAWYRHERPALLAPPHRRLHQAFGVGMSGRPEQLAYWRLFHDAPAVQTAASSAISAATPRS